MGRAEAEENIGTINYNSSQCVWSKYVASVQNITWLILVNVIPATDRINMS
jgi:hypothetical protein